MIRPVADRTDLYVLKGHAVVSINRIKAECYERQWYISALPVDQDVIAVLLCFCH